MDTDEIKRRIEGLVKYDSEIRDDGCPCCEPQPYATMVACPYGEYVSLDELKRAFGL